ncbi:MAG TPA: WecB/TagA/CpsF family glycosyltransferase [Acetobacteraceae bacterium]|nr:WecB/TagA/CpsF family glycosyltransferase [Acetobacteraceae bacterium]
MTHELRTHLPHTHSSAQSTRLLGVRVDDIPRDAIVDRICDAAVNDRRLLVLNVNVHMLMLAREHQWLRCLLDDAGVVFCDGAGVQLASLLLMGTRPHRSTPPEWAGTATRKLATQGRSIFWLGGKPDVTEKAVRNFEMLHGARVAGWQHGFFDQRPGSDDNRALIEHINRAAPDVLFVTMGMPLQEFWLHHHWPLLNAKVAIAAGALVDHAAGHVRRPPQWVANLGLEWAVRLAVEPRRLWRRYLLELPVFGAVLLREMILRRETISAIPLAEATSPPGPKL